MLLIPSNFDPFRDFTFHSSSSIIPRESSKEEVKVEIKDDRVLQIRKERNVEKKDKNDMFHHVEWSSGKFLRRFRLLENAKMDQVKMSMENGVLTITKEEVKKVEVKSIMISS
ncbi:hypothetical protein K2173_013709 [Erythroxylum novogranatense]|uniref:SHSP domain-containing protein n=1 Tax=Erythroxylum novogranatense TaxID=1862640 RepID=A0AAV8SAE7_9ROSI|nr:hypothetical protein K2173_013709 [Erythroxylum novogranatense]